MPFQNFHMLNGSTFGNGNLKHNNSRNAGLSCEWGIRDWFEVDGGKARFISETGHLCQAFEIPIGAILVARLMVMILHIVPRLRLAPGNVVPFELKPLAN